MNVPNKPRTCILGLQPKQPSNRLFGFFLTFQVTKRGDQGPIEKKACVRTQKCPTFHFDGFFITLKSYERVCLIMDKDAIVWVARALSE